MALSPKPAVDELRLEKGDRLVMTVDGGRLVLTRATEPRRRYTLAEILASVNPDIPLTDDEAEADRQWLDSPPAGREAI